MFLGGENQHRWVDLRADTPIHLPSDEFLNTIVRNSIRDFIDGTDDQGVNLAGISFPGIESLLTTPEPPKSGRGLHMDRAMLGLATVGIGIAAIAPTEIARAQTTPETPGDGRVNIVFIGDSIGVGADVFGGLREDLASLGNVTYDARESRPLVMPGCDEPQPTDNCITISDGVRVIEANSDAIRDADIVIIELGTNDSVSQYEARLRRVLNDTLSAGSRDGEMPIVVVPELFYTGNSGTADQKNEIAGLVISDFQDNGYDIRSIDLQHLNIPTSDGVHPTGDGARQLAAAIAAEIIPIASEPRLGVALPGTSDAPAPDGQPNLFERVLNNIRSLPDQIFGDDEPARSSIVINPAAIDWNIVQQNDPALNQIISNVETAEAVQARTEQEATETPAAPQAAPGIVVENGEPRTYLGNHTSGSTIVVNEGFGDVRNVGNGSYAQGNFDSQSHASPESDTGEPTPLVAPVPGIIHLTETSGEGNKVIVEIGIDAASGGTIIWYGTHLSDFAVEEGQIVMAGDNLGMSGQTGTATGVHHSTGLAIVPYGEWDDYLNSSEALNPFDYMPYVDITCLDSATDNDGEYCGPTQPGVYYSLPVHPDVLAFLQAQGRQPSTNDNGGINVEINLGGIDWNLIAPPAEQPAVVLPSDTSGRPITVPESIPAEPGNTLPGDTEAAPDEDKGIIVDPSLVVWGEAPGPEQAGPAADAPWLQNIPQDTRDLYIWASAQPDCATVDMRTVAAEDWVENRGWSPIDENWSDNEHSSADAGGRFQFIPSTWFGREGVGWDRANDPSAYDEDAMARDGDGDGVRDPYNVYDQIIAACVHNQGSAGLPITYGEEELSGDLYTDLQNLIFYKGNDTLLGHIANYNGDGNTDSDVPLGELPHNRQNPEYIRLAAALLLSDFSQAIRVADGEIEVIEP